MKVVQYQINVFTSNREVARTIAEDLLPFQDVAIIIGSFAEIDMAEDTVPDNRIISNHMTLKDMAK